MKASQRVATMSSADFKEETLQGRLRSAYLFSGLRDLELGKMLSLLEKSPVGGATGVIRETFSIEENFADALSSARLRPMWGEHKVLVVYEIDRLTQESKKTLLEQLKRYLDDPSDWVTWAFCEEKSSTIGRLLGGKVASVGAPKISKSRLFDWVRNRLKEAGLQIEQEALDDLIELFGEDWTALERELDKILAAFPEGKQIGRRDLTFLVGAETEQSVFDLLPLVAEGKTGAALEKMDRILHQSKHPKEEGIRLWYWFYRQARELLVARQVLEEKREWGQAVRAGLRPKAQGILLRQAKNYSKSELRKQLRGLEQVDRQMKSSYTLQSSLLLERYLAALDRESGK